MALTESLILIVGTDQGKLLFSYPELIKSGSWQLASEFHIENWRKSNIRDYWCFPY
jgi:hypothetical protein